eukprot:132681-Chlamydomonas_euryale.AAC.1
MVGGSWGCARATRLNRAGDGCARGWGWQEGSWARLEWQLRWQLGCGRDGSWGRPTETSWARALGEDQVAAFFKATSRQFKATLNCIFNSKAFDSRVGSRAVSSKRVTIAADAREDAAKEREAARQLRHRLADAKDAIELFADVRVRLWVCGVVWEGVASSSRRATQGTAPAFPAAGRGRSATAAERLVAGGVRTAARRV